MTCNIKSMLPLCCADAVIQSVYCILGVPFILIWSTQVMVQRIDFSPWNKTRYPKYSAVQCWYYTAPGRVARCGKTSQF